MMTQDNEYHTASETAGLLGITIKALKVYEAKGLLTPMRTAAGWRVYGPEHMETITTIVALKSAGFSLAMIKTMLEGGIDIKEALQKQHQSLRKQAVTIEKAMAIIKEAEQCLTTQGALSVEMLETLAKETARLHAWTDKDAEFARNYYTEDQQNFHHTLKTSVKGRRKIQQVWEGLIEDVEAAVKSNLSDQEAFKLVERWQQAMAVFTKNDPTLEKATQQWLEDGFADPEMAKRMPFSETVWRYMKNLTANIEARD